MAPEESLLSEFAIPEAPVVGRQLTLKSDSRVLIRMCVQLAEQNEAVIPLKHPIHKWVKEQGHRLPKLGKEVNRNEWPSFALNCPEPVMGLDASKEAFHLTNGIVIIWDPEIFFPVLQNQKAWKACIKCGSVHGIRRDQLTIVREVKGLRSNFYVAARKYRHQECPGRFGTPYH
jgi:hypothetical protein